MMVDTTNENDQGHEFQDFMKAMGLQPLPKRYKDEQPAALAGTFIPGDSKAVLDEENQSPIQEGGRNTALVSLGGALRRRGLQEDLLLQILLTQNKAVCEPPLPIHEVERIAASVSRYKPQPQKDIVASLTDVGNSTRFAHDWKDRVRYIPQLKKWILWDGTRWFIDNSMQIMELGKETARRIYEEGVALNEDQLRVAVAKHAVRSMHLPRLKAMLELAQSIPHMVAQASELDKDPLLLCVKNGVLDLRTGMLRPAKPEDLMTKQAPVEFDPQASCPAFKAFLKKIMHDSSGLYAFMQRVMGYALTGHTKEQCLLFLYGSGANGKTTFLNTIKDVLGPDYCKQTDPDTLMAKKNGRGATNDLARLQGARVVISNEIEEGSRLSESLIKQMTGGDPITARFLFAEFMEYVPQFKLLMAGNHQPVIRGDDTGIWRRLHLVPFTVTIPPKDRDTELATKLRGELSGILNFALEGCLAWQRNGLQPPAEVTDAVKDYRGDMDVLGQWVSDSCNTDSKLEVSATSAYLNYKIWSSNNGFNAMSSNSFGRRLKDRGFGKRHASSGAVYQGLALKGTSSP